MSARGRPDPAAEKAAARGAGLLVGRHNLPGFLVAVLTNPNDAPSAVSQLVIGSQGS
jgi:hypothetical protein